MRVGLRFIVHLSKPFLTRTLCQTANPTTDGFQYVGVGVGEQKVGESFFTQVYVDTLDVVVLIPEACFSGDVSAVGFTDEFKVRPGSISEQAASEVKQGWEKHIY